MNRLKKGFTLIELIVVIAVIGILATVTIVGLGRYQADTRDAGRAASITTIAEALEKYYDANGEYPSCGALTADGGIVSNDVLKGTAAKSLVAPQAVAGTTNSIKCTAVALGGADIFEYSGDGSSSCLTNTACLSYDLKYKEESSNSIKTISSRRKGSILTSGNITNLTATAVDFQIINLAWSGVTNASGYNVQVATAPTFASTIINTSTSGTTYAATGLTASTLYYARVQPKNGTDVGNWSNTASATTFSLATPTLAGTVDSSTQITVSWNSVASATSYTLERSTNSDYSSAVITSGITGSGTITNVNSGLTTGTTYYFRVKAVNAVTSSGYSTYSGTPIVPPPAAFALTSTGYVTPTANVTCSLGTPYYYWYANGGAWVEGASYRSPTYSLGYGQGINLTARARCDLSGTSSTWTSGNNTISSTRPVPGPTWTRLQYVSDRHTWIEWTNVCGGPNEVISYQGSYNSGWNAPLYNGSGPGGGRSYNNYWLGEYADWSSYGATTHYVRTTCNGSVGTSGPGGISF